MAIDYSTPGLLTDLAGVPSDALDAVPADPVAICSAVSSLVVQPDDARRAGVDEARLAESQIRPAGELVRLVLALDPAPLTVARPLRARIVGTCRHFAVLSCALLRHRGIAARARCGFATYFQPELGVDHWITEYRDELADRWVRIDSEILGLGVLDDPADLQPGQFLSGGEAWQAYRRGGLDATKYGVYGTQNFGPSEIRGNAVRDLAALNKFEMLPWDEWGRMADAYDGKTGDDYDALLDTVADVCATDDPQTVVELYEHEDLRVPADLIDQDVS